MPDLKHIEKKLFSRIAEGDEEAFRTFFRLYLPQIVPVIGGVIKTEAAVKDVAQDIFLQIWIARDKLRDIDAPRSWVFRVTYYQCYKWLRQQGVRTKVQQELAVQLENTPHLHTQEDLAVFNETSRLVRRAIDILPEQARRIYQLSREENLKIQEIADQLDLSPQTVKNSLTRSLRSLRDFLAEHDIHLPVILFYFLIR